MKIFNLSICFGLIIAVILSLARFDALCEDLRDNVFRLHIVAASDSTEDQALKLRVRDAVLKAKGEEFKGCTDVEKAVLLAESNTEEYKKIAEEIIKANGFDYKVQVRVETCYFENREYDNFTLPAGNYEALNIVIDKGEGKNWWCVMFPAVCIGAAGELKDSVNEESVKVAENSVKYEIRFKTVEIYEDLKKFFTKSKK